MSAVDDGAGKRRDRHRFGWPAEIAAAILYLLSDDASFTTAVAPAGRRRLAGGMMG